MHWWEAHRLVVTTVAPQVCPVSQVGACLISKSTENWSIGLDLSSSQLSIETCCVNLSHKDATRSGSCQALAKPCKACCCFISCRKSGAALSCTAFVHSSNSVTSCTAVLVYKLHHKIAAHRCRKRSTTLGMLAMGSIEEALKSAGAEDDLQTILQVLEDKSVGFKRHEAAAGPFANMDTTMLTGLNIRMLSAIKRAQQQQQHQGRPLSTKFCVTMWLCTCKRHPIHLASEQSHCRLSASSVAQGVPSPLAVRLLLAMYKLSWMLIALQLMSMQACSLAAKGCCIPCHSAYTASFLACCLST